MELHWLLPGDPATLTGGYLYDRHIVDGLRAAAWRVRVHSLDASFPQPTLAALEDAERVLAALPDAAHAVIDGLACGAMPALVERHARRLRLTALVHHPLADETGLDPDLRAWFFAQERRALAAVGRVVVTSAQTARALAGYGVASDRIAVVEPGVNPAPLAHGGGRVFTLLCVATLTPRKGHDVLLDALADLRERSWRLNCVGALDRDPAHAARVRTQCARLGLDERVAFYGAVDAAALERRYAESDVFVLASWHEGYGMVLAEALARGLPIVSTTAGAIPETVPAGAGVLVPPGDVAGLSAALARVLDDAVYRSQLAAGARIARAQLATWAMSAVRFAEALRVATV